MAIRKGPYTVRGPKVDIGLSGTTIRQSDDESNTIFPVEIFVETDDHQWVDIGEVMSVYEQWRKEGNARVPV